MSESSAAPIVVLVTVPADRAAAMARTLVSERLAGCVNQLAVVSTYRWKDGIEIEDETLLIIKSMADRTEALETRVRELHSYDVPEFVVLEARAVADTYLAWLADASRAP